MQRAAPSNKLPTSWEFFTKLKSGTADGAAHVYCTCADAFIGWNDSAETVRDESTRPIIGDKHHDAYDDTDSNNNNNSSSSMIHRLVFAFSRIIILTDESTLRSAGFADPQILPTSARKCLSVSMRFRLGWHPIGCSWITPRLKSSSAHLLVDNIILIVYTVG